jgi:hypothetical protein
VLGEHLLLQPAGEFFPYFLQDENERLYSSNTAVRWHGVGRRMRTFIWLEDDAMRWKISLCVLLVPAAILLTRIAVGQPGKARESAARVTAQVQQTVEELDAAPQGYAALPAPAGENARALRLVLPGGPQGVGLSTCLGSVSGIENLFDGEMMPIAVL